MRRFLTGRTSTPTCAKGGGATSRNGPLKLRSTWAMILAALAVGLVFALFPSAGFGTLQPTIGSDQADYTAGSLVKLDGTNWTADTSVTIFVDDAGGHTWQHTAAVSVAADGSIHDEFTLSLNFIANYSVTATGDQTGTVATTSFTDDAGADIDQCANGDIPRD